MSDKWYVRSLDDGVVFGPYSRAEAEGIRDRLEDAVMFDESIFEPKFSTSAEVEELVNRLRSLNSTFLASGSPVAYWRNKPDSILIEAVDALILLSREKLDTPLVDTVVADTVVIADNVSSVSM